MIVLSSPNKIQSQSLEWKSKGQQVGFVPTMGCLHEGHLALVKQSLEMCDRTIVSLFVNPLQFDDIEDFQKYPRQFEQDKKQLRSLGIDSVFEPQAKDLYPKGFDTIVKVGKINNILCGASREGHFDGVATICLKLFQSTQPDVVIFGEKDYQQVRVIQQLITDFNLPLKLEVHPIVREATGLAMSSRNKRLAPQEQEIAPLLYKSLQIIKNEITSGQTSMTVLRSQFLNELSRAHELKLDYFEILDGQSLNEGASHQDIRQMKSPRAFVAAFLGEVRLIDNLSLSRQPLEEEFAHE